MREVGNEQKHYNGIPGDMFFLRQAGGMGASSGFWDGRQSMKRRSAPGSSSGRDMENLICNGAYALMYRKVM